ncbi:ABC transporter permease [Phenylobacterium terrae]|uniref:ABC transporter permease n=1 Tax=Phenylobacterium terrae TaxID=2665495 RepID=A0ABW4N205_9CAUL
MFGNYLAAALRNLTRNRLYASVTIAGLAIGFAAAMLIGLYVRDEFTFDRFIPGHERVYRVSQTVAFKGARPIETDFTPMMLAVPFREDFPEVASLARLTNSYFPPAVRRGETAAAEANFYWADPEFFRVLPLPAVAGDLTRALEAPDSVVLTRAMARKYFGRDAPVGESLTVNGQPMRVTAVIEDLPSNTHLPFEALGSSLNAMSPISQYEETNGPLTNTLATYFRLRDGASVASMEPRLASFLERRLPIPANWDTNGPVSRKLHLVPLADIHMRPSTHGAYKPAGQPAVVAAIGGVGVLIVVVAGINFVTLMTARATRRAVEVGVRKAAGASRRDLFWQFMGEAGLYVLLAGVLAVALAELALPAFNAFLQRRIGFDYLGDPWLAAAVAGVLLVTALLAGLYPALVLSSFRPAAVLKGASPAVGGAGLRQVLVVVQFAVLIGLVLATITIARQTLFALNEGMRVETDQVVLVFSAPCLTAMRDEVRKLPGVKDAACAESGALNLSDGADTVVVDGRRASITTAGVDYGLLELFGVEPLAGRFFDRNRPSDAVERADAYPPVVINETAMRKLGFASPEQAVGKTISWHGLWDDSLRDRRDWDPTARPSEIIGVAPDFTFGSMRSTIQPTLFSMSRHKPPLSVALAVKLDGQSTPETLAAIDRLWKRYGGGRPILRVFADQFTMRLYIDTLTQGATIALAAIIALSIACLGLFALSAYTTERRTKEIGIRKAMGASSVDVLKLLVWQFTKPVLIANLIAWPVAWMAMNSWLNGFAYRVDVAPWTFAAAAGAALLIAWATVVFHALKVARAKPVGALRYE